MPRNEHPHAAGATRATVDLLACSLDSTLARPPANMQPTSSVTLPLSSGTTRRAPVIPPMRMANAFHYRLGSAYVRACVDLQVEGSEHLRALPVGRGYLLAANHVSHFDPPLLSAAAGRWIDWMAMAELYRGPLTRAFWNALGAIRVNRALRLDRAAASAALTRLRAGRAVGIFPERGIRTGAGSVLASRDAVDAASRLDLGACRLALGARVPVVPVVIRGSAALYGLGIWAFPRRARVVTIRFGAPLVHDPSEGHGKPGAAVLHRRLAAALLDLARPDP